MQCGGSPAAFSAAQPLLGLMGSRSIHCGGPSTGQAAKLCNNLVLAGVRSQELVSGSIHRAEMLTATLKSDQQVCRYVGRYSLEHHVSHNMQLD